MSEYREAREPERRKARRKQLLKRAVSLAGGAALIVIGLLTRRRFK